MRYAGIDITPAKHPAHVDTVVLDDADTEKLRAWFRAEPLPAAKPAPTPLLEVKGLSFGYSKDQHTLSDVSFTIGKGGDGQHRGPQRRGQVNALQADLRL